MITLAVYCLNQGLRWSQLTGENGGLSPAWKDRGGEMIRQECKYGRGCLDYPDGRRGCKLCEEIIKARKSVLNAITTIIVCIILLIGLVLYLRFE